MDTTQLLALILGLGWAISTLINAQARKSNADAQLQQSYLKLSEADRAELALMRARYDSLHNEHVSMQSQLTNATSQVRAADATIDALNKKQANQSVEHTAQQAQITSLLKEIEDSKKRSADNLAAIQAMRDEIETMKKTHAQLISEKDAEIERLKREKAELEKRIEQLEKEKNELQTAEKVGANGDPVVALPPAPEQPPPPQESKG